MTEQANAPALPSAKRKAACVRRKADPTIETRKGCALSKAKIDIICKGVRLGVSAARSAPLAGVSRKTVWLWRQEAAMMEDRPAKTHREKLLKYFAAELEKAETEMQTRILTQIQQQIPADWRAGAWVLEHAFPNEFATHSTIDATIRAVPMLDALSAAAEAARDGGFVGDSQ